MESKMDRPEYVVSGDVARLIPTYSETQKEGRSTSALLAVLMAVPAFAKRLLDPVGVSVGKTSRLGCFTEVVFKNQPKNSGDRPDGLIISETGKRQWRAIIEAKVGNAQLDAKQLQSYLLIAKENDIDALITISNQFAALPTHHPIDIDRRGSKNIGLYHWSWTSVLTQAMLLLADDDELIGSDRYLVSELVRYLSHDKSGLTRFDRMNPEWKELVSSVQAHTPLRKETLTVTNSVSSWFEEERDLSLLLTRKLRRSVDLKLPRAHKSDPAARHSAACDLLAKEFSLESVFEIPNAAAPLHVKADIARKSIVCSMKLNAPTDRKSPSARVNWLLRQLSDSSSKNIFVRAHWPGRSQPTQASLEALRQNPEGLDNPNGSKDLLTLEVIYVADIAARFSQTTKFIEELETHVPQFYQQVGQKLRAWVEPPPKYRSDTSGIVEPTADTDVPMSLSNSIGGREAQAGEMNDGQNLSIESAFASTGMELELPAFLRR